MDIKAIETCYAGCRFRSRLEARWAVFFDALGLEWEYEPEGFELPAYAFDSVGMVERHRSDALKSSTIDLLEGLAAHLASLAAKEEWYLPDFWLPKGEMWAEVKPKPGGSLEEVDKAMRLVNGTGYPLVWCMDLTGEPLKGMAPDAARYPGRVEFIDVHFGASPNELMRAAKAARSARFEHGETPRIK